MHKLVIKLSEQKMHGETIKVTQKSNLVKIRPLGVELFHADQRTDRYDESGSCFLQFCDIT